MSFRSSLIIKYRSQHEINFSAKATIESCVETACMGFCKSKAHIMGGHCIMYGCRCNRYTTLEKQMIAKHTREMKLLYPWVDWKVDIHRQRRRQLTPSWYEEMYTNDGENYYRLNNGQKASRRIASRRTTPVLFVFS